MSNTHRSRSPRVVMTSIPEDLDCASRKQHDFAPTESAESGAATPRQDERVARERAAPEWCKVRTGQPTVKCEAASR